MSIDQFRESGDFFLDDDDEQEGGQTASADGGAAAGGQRRAAAPRRSGGPLFGLTPFQRFVLSFMLFVMSILGGALVLIATGRIMP